jgi:carboxypeptidase D
MFELPSLRWDRARGPEDEGNLSANPTEHVLPQVIEAANRVLVANGDYDMIISSYQPTEHC